MVDAVGESEHASVQSSEIVDGAAPSSGLSATFSPDSGEKGHGGSRYLAPIELRGGSSGTGPCVNKRGTRCSNKGFLPMSAADYLGLLDWTARHV